MKRVRKVLAVVLTMVMLFAMGATAAADEITTGTITIENATKGMTYQAYKLFDVTYNAEGGVAYKVSADKKDSLSTTLFDVSNKADAEGNYIFGKKSTVDDGAVVEWMKSNYTSFAGSAINGDWGTNDSTYVFSELDFGYYYITSSLGTAVTINSAAPTVTVRDKNDSAPEVIGKYITAEGTEVYNTGKTENEASVGTVETFEIKFNAVNWITTANSSAGTVETVQAESYTVTDTPEGLDINVNTVKVYVSDNGTEKDITSETTISKNESTGVVNIQIPWVDANDNSLYQPKLAVGMEKQTPHIPVRIVYEAVVEKAAATEGASNRMEVFYNITFSLGNRTTKTTTYKFQLNKSKEDYSDLLGSKFELYRGSVSDANKMKFSVSGNTYTVDPNGTIAEIDLTVNANAIILGLDKAEYVLCETAVPAGYNQAENLTIRAADLVVYDAELTDVKNQIDGDSTGVITVVNQQGTVLPSTGGMGTYIFYAAGAVLALGAVVILVTKKRMNGKK